MGNGFGGFQVALYCGAKEGLVDAVGVCIVEPFFRFIDSGFDGGAVLLIVEISAAKAVDFGHCGVADIGFAQYILAALVAINGTGVLNLKGLHGLFLAVTSACYVVGDHVCPCDGNFQAQGFLPLMGQLLLRLVSLR